MLRIYFEELPCDVSHYKCEHIFFTSLNFMVSYEIEIKMNFSDNVYLAQFT